MCQHQNGDSIIQQCCYYTTKVLFYQEEYEQLSMSCQTFATALLAQTRGSAELAVVLNHESGSKEARLYETKNENSNQSMQLHRLKLAIRYEQKMVRP